MDGGCGGGGNGVGVGMRGYQGCICTSGTVRAWWICEGGAWPCRYVQ